MTYSFDMDGTFANLYGVNGWLEDLKAERTRPYAEATPLFDMVGFRRMLKNIKDLGHKVEIVSWGSKNASPEFDEAVKMVKLDWLQEHGLMRYIDKVNVVHYGTPKSTIPAEIGILFDDEEKNRKEWEQAGGVAYDQNFLAKFVEDYT